MAIVILIADSSEIDQFVSFGLDLALNLDKPLAILCIAKTQQEKAPTELETSATKPVRFAGRQSMIEGVQQTLYTLKQQDRCATIAAEVFEIAGHTAEILRWLDNPPHTEALGRFQVETLFIPMRRDEDDDARQAAKDNLFCRAHCETVLAVINRSQEPPVPLDTFACAAVTAYGLSKSQQFARRFRPARPIVMSWHEDGPKVDCAVLTIRGKPGRTRIDNNSVWNSMRRDASLPIAMGVNPADSMRERSLWRLDGLIQSVFSEYQMERKDRERLASVLTDGTRASPEFLLFMSIATLLASIGLLQDSPAVIIGAMLVAPLMTPLLGAGLAMIQGNRPLFLNAIQAILVGLGVSFVIGMVMGAIASVIPTELFAGSELRLTNAMISRSHPNLLDPLIGFAAGLAGGFVVGRDKKIGALAGVAIAAALVPPIATAGIEASIVAAFAFTEHGASEAVQLLSTDPAELLSSRGLIDDDHRATSNVRLVFAPLALFLMNACTVILGAFLGLRLVGMHRTMYPKESKRWVSIAALSLIIALISLLIVVPIVALYTR